MALRCWLPRCCPLPNRSFLSGGRRRIPQRSSRRLQLEPLEDRLVLSGTASVPLNAIRLLTEFTNVSFQGTLNSTDDGSTTALDLGFGINLFGNLYDKVFVNNNGNLTFDHSLSVFTPASLTGSPRDLIAPFFADVDTRTSNPVLYWRGLLDNKAAFVATWPGVGYFNQHADKLNAFQVVLVNQGNQNFDIEFNYNQIQWESGDQSGGTNGLGGHSAYVGFAADNQSYDMPGSGTPGSFLDSNPRTGLIHRSRHSPILGRYVFHIHNGQVDQLPAINPVQVLVDGRAPTAHTGTVVNGRVLLGQGQAVTIGTDNVLAGLVSLAGPYFEPVVVSVNYGDGTPRRLLPRQANGTFVIPLHTYARAGNYFATVTVSDGLEARHLSFVVNVLAAEEMDEVLETELMVLTPRPDRMVREITRPLSDAVGNAMWVEISLPPSPVDVSMTLSLASYAHNPTPGKTLLSSQSPNGTMLSFFDIRFTNALAALGATIEVTFELTVPTSEARTVSLFFFDGATWVPIISAAVEREIYVNGVWREADEVDLATIFAPTVRLRLEVTLNANSRPSLEELDGTVFTLAVPTSSGSQIPTTVIPTTLVAGGGPGTGGSSTTVNAFASSPQLTLVLRVSQGTDLSASRAVVSVTSSPGGSGYLHGEQAADEAIQLQREFDLDWLFRMLENNVVENHPPAGPQQPRTQPAAQPVEDNPEAVAWPARDTVFARLAVDGLDVMGWNRLAFLNELVTPATTPVDYRFGALAMLVVLGSWHTALNPTSRQRRPFILC